MYVKGRGQALLGAGVQCVELVFSIKNILLVGIEWPGIWCNTILSISMGFSR